MIWLGDVHRLSSDRQELGGLGHTVRARVHSDETMASNTGNRPWFSHLRRSTKVGESMPRNAGRYGCTMPISLVDQDDVEPDRLVVGRDLKPRPRVLWQQVADTILEGADVDARQV